MKLHSRESEHAAFYAVDGVPALFIVDESGREWYQFPPTAVADDLIAAALLGKARFCLRHRDHARAKELLDRALSVAPGNHFRGEILYYLGWSCSRLGLSERLQPIFDEIQQNHGETLWASLLKP